ncbi:hypothetical protein [Methanomethylovorans sp.]|uniref:hypothetical protein n=1 Tax=Methanomethylovorans sp. TaxID=2758717 RepID=UPI00351CAD57
MTLTCVECAGFPCDNGAHLRTDKACDLFKPHEFHKIIEDKNGASVGIIYFTKVNGGIECKIQYAVKGKGYLATDPFFFERLSGDTKDQIHKTVCTYCTVTSREYVGLDLEAIYKELQSLHWYPKTWKHTAKPPESTEHATESTIQIDEIDIPEELKTAAQDEATYVLKNGNPVMYMLETIENIHIGDNRAAEGLLLAVASQSCLNTQGIQIKMSGESGGGKSHLCKAVTHCIRDKHIVESSLSSKAAYYAPLKPGSIIFSDDTEISEDMETVIKRATTNYQDDTLHTTVRDGRSMILKIPPRILWLITSVEDDVSDQLLNRQLIFNVDESSEQKNSIFEMQKKEALKGDIMTNTVTHRVLVCRLIWDMIKDKMFKVRIPFAEDIDIVDKSNTRNFPMFLDMVKAYAIMCHMQRDADDDGYLLATKTDFYTAKSLFESQTESVITKLNEKERRIIQAVGQAGKDGADINMIAGYTGYSYDVVRNALKGRPGKAGGLLEKVKKLRLMEETESESLNEDSYITTTTKKKDKFVLEGFNGWNIFDSGFVFLKSDRVNT